MKMKHFDQLFDRLEGAGLVVNLPKCDLGKGRVTYLSPGNVRVLQDIGSRFCNSDGASNQPVAEGCEIQYIWTDRYPVALDHIKAIL